jgi:hypothetical protein
MQPKTVASLEVFVQGRSEPLRDYIERFNKEVVQVRGANETMKLYFRREESYPLRSPKDSQRVPSDRKDLHLLRIGSVRGQPQQSQEGGACCRIPQR